MRIRTPCITAVSLATALTGGVASAADGAQSSAAPSASVREDFNGDGYADLATGVPFEAIGTRAAAGSVVLLKGGTGGLSGTGAQALHQDTPGVPGVAEAGDRFGGAVRLLDVTKNGRAELAASAPQENDTGAVWSLPGTTAGPTATGSIAFNPGDLGVPAANARFGAAFANESGTYLYPATP